MSQQPQCPVDHAPTSTILVVEDEALIRISLCEDLRACGFEVLEAGSAPEALALLEGEAEIDIVFSDVQMPGYIDGLGLALWILARRPEVSIVLTSGAYSANDLPEEFRRFIPIVGKPYDLSTVLRHLRMASRCTSRRNIGRPNPGGQHLQLVAGRPEELAIIAGGLAPCPFPRPIANASHGPRGAAPRARSLEKRKGPA